MRDRHFKSTPTRRPYRLSSKKSQVNISESSPISVHDDLIADNAAEDIETAPGVSESHVFKMDSDERDNVPLARLLKNGLFSNVEPFVADVPVTTAHSNESSSSEDIFVPTPSHPFATNEKVGQPGRSPLVRSSIQFSSSVDDQHSVPDSDPVGDSTVIWVRTLLILLIRILMQMLTLMVNLLIIAHLTMLKQRWMFLRQRLNNLQVNQDRSERNFNKTGQISLHKPEGRRFHRIFHLFEGFTEYSICSH